MSFALEDQLLIQASRSTLQENALAKCSYLVRQNLNWDYILEVSIRHAVAPLLFHGLTQLSSLGEIEQYIPRQVREELQKLYRGTQFRNRRLYRVMRDIAQAFTQAGIQAMGLKDLQLAKEVYPDIGLRPMGDLDILIHYEDYLKVAQCMKELGFKPLPSSRIPFTLKYAWAHAFQRSTDNVWVDMQWNIVQREWDIYHEGSFDFDIARVWRNAVPLALDDMQILAPRPEDMLFHLCLHLEGHQYGELILFCDIAEFLRHYERQFDWGYFIRMSKTYKAESSVYYVLLLTQKLFDAVLPPSLLRDLEPAYFKANIFSPLFDNLTSLHLSLEEIQLSVSPPEEVMKSFEGVVRRQAVGAMQAYKQIDALASTFMDSGASFMLLNGAASEKVFPDPLLKPFQELQFFILADDLPRMRRALLSSGFAPPEAPGQLETYAKNWEFVSVDPILASQPTLLTVRIEVERDLRALFSCSDAARGIKRDIALRWLKAKLTNSAAAAHIPVQIKLIALTPEELFLYLCVQSARQTTERLFGACRLLEFFRGYSGSLDWRQITDAASRYDVKELVGEAIMMVSELVSCERIPPVARELFGCSEVQPRMLEWARYGPAALLTYPDFKRAFFYLLSFLSLPGVSAKSHYLLHSLIGRQGEKPILPGLLLESATSVFSLLRRTPQKTRDLAYWIEPDAVSDPERVSNSLV